MTVNDLFEEARARIAVPDEVLKEARKRRGVIRGIVGEEGTAPRTFELGSLAHGTQNDPLNDVNAGVVLEGRVYEDLCPDGRPLYHSRALGTAY
jgi:hypothetical protein